jgi:hypothetical protein
MERQERLSQLEEQQYELPVELVQAVQPASAG